MAYKTHAIATVTEGELDARAQLPAAPEAAEAAPPAADAAADDAAGPGGNIMAVRAGSTSRVSQFLNVSSQALMLEALWLQPQSFSSGNICQARLPLAVLGFVMHFQAPLQQPKKQVTVCQGAGHTPMPELWEGDSSTCMVHTGLPPAPPAAEDAAEAADANCEAAAAADDAAPH